MLLKQLGRQFGKAGSWQEGIAVERRFLIDSMRIDSTEFALEDGSGLRAANLVSPERLHAAPPLHPAASAAGRPSRRGCRRRAAWARSGPGS